MSQSSVERIWFFCPVYFDVDSFLILRARLLSVVNALAPSPHARFVVVDDTAGLDPAMKSLESLEGVTVIAPPFSLGHQRALVFGLRRSAPNIQDTDIVVTMDSDGEDQPEDAPRLLQPLLSKPRHTRLLVLARRTKRRETLAYRVLYLAFKGMFRLLTGRVIETGNYAAYRGWVARQVVFHPHFDLCYSSSLISLSLPVEYVPCARGGRYAGKSRMGYFRLAVHGMRMLMPFLDRIAVRALVAASGTVVLGVMVSMALALRWALGTAGRMLPDWLNSMLLLLGALMLLLLGFSNLVTLFALFSQSQGFSLSALDGRFGQGMGLPNQAHEPTVGNAPTRVFPGGSEPPW